MTWVLNGTAELDAQSRYIEILIITIITTLFMTGAVTIRWLKCRDIAKFKWELIPLTIAAACSIVYNCLCIEQTRYGLGLPLDLRPQADMACMFKYNYAGRPFYLLGIGAFKASLIICYWRITRRTTLKFFRGVCYLMMGYCSCGTVAWIAVNLFSCTPIRRAWTGPGIDGYCLNYGATNYVISSLNVAADSITFSMPLFITSVLMMNRKQKIRFFGAFALGFITTAFSGLRIWGLHFNDNGRGDLVYVVLFGSVELNVGITTCCIPFIIPKGRVQNNQNIRMTFITTPPPPGGSNEPENAPKDILVKGNDWVFLVPRDEHDESKRSSPVSDPPSDSISELPAEPLKSRPRHIDILQRGDPHDWTHE